MPLRALAPTPDVSTEAPSCPRTEAAGHLGSFPRDTAWAMSQENVEIVKALNEAFNRRDWNGLWRESGGVGRGLRQRRGEEALHRVEWLDALVCSTQNKGALESREEYGGIVLCG